MCIRDRVDIVKSLDVDKAIDLLNYGVCVKECPSSDKSTPVECKPTKHTRDPANGFSAQVDKTDGTEWPGGEYCIQEIDTTYMEDFGIDISAYTGLSEE